MSSIRRLKTPLLGEFVRERQAAIIDGWTERARVYFSTKGLPGSPFLEQLPQILANLIKRSSAAPCSAAASSTFGNAKWVPAC
jgi:hypothetical protein